MSEADGWCYAGRNDQGPFEIGAADYTAGLPIIVEVQIGVGMLPTEEEHAVGG